MGIYKEDCLQIPYLFLENTRIPYLFSKYFINSVQTNWRLAPICEK